MADTKDLKYYLDHPDEMPTDPKILETLANDQIRAITGENEKDLTIDRFVTTDPVNKDERTGASSDAEAKAVEEAKVAAEAAQKAKDADVAAKAAADAEAAKVAEDAAKAAIKEAPVGVLAKDGKNVIPFAVLSSARERAEAAERLVQQLASENEQLKTAKAGNATAQTAQTELLTNDELEALAEDSPTLAKVLRSLQDRNQQLTETVEKLANHATAQIVDAETEAKNTVQEAIDSNPILAGWQVAEDQSHWNEAARLDKALRESPLWKDKSFDDRFAEVVKLTHMVFGEAEPAPAVQEKAPVAPQPTEAEIRAAAEAKLAAKNKAALPVSLSQIPGGTPPAVDERERVEQMSSVELGSKFLGMNKDQLDAYLATL